MSSPNSVQPTSQVANTYKKIESAIQYFVANQSKQPSLADVAASVHLSEYHLQRLFAEWAGVSPKQFLQYLTKENAKQYLREMSVMDASLASGLSGSGRLHDLMISCEGVTPGEFKRGGQGLDIIYGEGECVFGRFFLARTDRGICKLAFFDEDDEFDFHAQALLSDWPNARCKRDDHTISALAFSIFPENRKESKQAQQSLRVLLKGTPFQMKVWEALLSIPEGVTCTYQDVANRINAPTSVRAVASAIARNEIGYLIPCHRVIRGTGEFSNYRWGTDRKPAMIGWERCRVLSP